MLVNEFLSTLVHGTITELVFQCIENSFTYWSRGVSLGHISCYINIWMIIQDKEKCAEVGLK